MILKKYVFRKTKIQHLNLPSVTKIENYAFDLSKLRSLIVENCECIEEEAFVEEDDIEDDVEDDVVEN